MSAVVVVALCVRSTCVSRRLVRKNLGAGHRQRGEEHLGEEIVIEKEARSAWAGICLGRRRPSSRARRRSSSRMGKEELPRPEEIVLQDAPG
jgi:hypothetical protein